MPFATLIGGPLPNLGIVAAVSYYLFKRLPYLCLRFAKRASVLRRLPLQREAPKELACGIPGSAASLRFAGWVGRDWCMLCGMPRRPADHPFWRARHLACRRVLNAAPKGSQSVASTTSLNSTHASTERRYTRRLVQRLNRRPTGFGLRLHVIMESRGMR